MRVYEQVRTAHLERAHTLSPATIVYRTRRYDFDASLATGLDLVAANSWELAAVVGNRRVRAVEVNEPLMESGLGRAALAIAIAKLTSRVRRTPTAVVSYAIENRNPFRTRPSGWKASARRRLNRLLARYTYTRLDRIAFGSAQALRTYEEALGPPSAHTATSTIEALPAACACPTRGNVPASVLFIGAFVPRKGLLELLEAWPGVVAEEPGANLTLIGKGRLHDEVQNFATNARNVRVILDPPRSVIHRELRTAKVLVLLSQPTSGWREQIGLPIVEGLAHGCHVVTTDQTGLADWLSDHNHFVLPSGADASATTAQIVNALRSTRSRESIIADLPPRDGRLEADRWLLRADHSPADAAAEEN